LLVSDATGVVNLTLMRFPAGMVTSRASVVFAASGVLAVSGAAAAAAADAGADAVDAGAAL
jgi:hypothetical protein